MLADRLAEHGIRLPSYGIGSRKVRCPTCSEQRRNKCDPCLSVTIDDEGAVWLCHNCGWAGGVKDRPVEWQRRSRPAPRPVVKIGPLPPEACAWFQTRGISADTLTRAGVGWSNQWIPAKGAAADCIAFPYRWNGEVVNAKFRTLDKAFAQVKDGAKVLYLADLVDPEHGDRIVITEGEIDALSLLEAGVLNAISVPDGAPEKVKQGEIDPAEDCKFSYIWTCRKLLDPYPKIVIATDADAPGRALAEELARRLGRTRCWLVAWPDGCKDANDVLVRHGAAELVACIEEARPYPVKSLHGAEAFRDGVLDLYRHGRARGFSTGWPCVDEFYTVVPGQLTVVTGKPGAGKSEWTDALAVNLAEREDWCFAICSFENPPVDHISKLVEKRLRMPFREGPRARMGEGDLTKGIEWVGEHFHFIRADDESPTIDWILETATAAVARFGIRGLIIDPYNEIEHRRPDGMSETEYVSQILGKVRRFALNHGTHVWFAVHPAKMLRDRNGKVPTPTLYDISGSAHWVNKADAGIVVHRTGDDGAGQTEIHIRKVRFKWVGRLGTAVLDYDRATGIYSEPAPARRHWAAE